MFLNTINRNVFLYPEDKYVSRETSQLYGCFDIETTTIDNYTFLYCWSYTDHTGTYFGRTWRDYLKLKDDIEKAYKKKIVVYVHNLPFEFQFMRSVMHVDKVFATNVRKIVSFESELTEYRCSYKLTNMSLKKLCESENVETPKLENFNYSIERYPDTELTDFEISYSCVDTMCLYDAIGKLLTFYNDNLKSIPKTSTGYVRREAREQVLANENNKKRFKKEMLDIEQYQMCLLASRGGNTHANYLYTGQILSYIDSFDEKSAYPEMMITRKYPFGKGITEYHPKSVEIPSETCSVMLCQFENIKLKHNVFFPYIPFAKCLEFSGDRKYNCNGRVVRGERLVMMITDIDLNIIISQYDIEKITCLSRIVWDCDYLNREYREYIFYLFQKKCELEDGDRYYYAKFKNKLNATFGMMLTSILRDKIIYENNDWKSLKPDDSLELYKYYNSSKSFLSYQHGLFVTAHARQALQQALDIVGIDAVYCDTDSVKCLQGHRSDFEKLNEKIHNFNQKCDIQPIITIGDKKYELGLWEDEGDGKPMYKEFITQGAKKYAYIYSDGKCGITVAGVSKQKGAEKLEKIGIENFDDGLTFMTGESGKLQAVYDDEIRFNTKVIKGHVVEDTSNVSLIDTTYTLNKSSDYIYTLDRMRHGD